MIISLIVAMDRNYLIGNNGKLPWHIPADLERFKSITMGKVIAMGKGTHLSIRKVLPGRINIVLTRDKNFSVKDARVVYSVSEAVIEAMHAGCKELIFIGGAEIYREVMTTVQKVYMTVIDHDFEGNTYFPISAFNAGQWSVVSEELINQGEKTDYNLKFTIYERR